MDSDKRFTAEAVMNRAHQLHVAIIQKRLPEELAGRTIRQYLAAGWVLGEKGVTLALERLESALDV